MSLRVISDSMEFSAMGLQGALLEISGFSQEKLSSGTFQSSPLRLKLVKCPGSEQ